MRPAAAGLVKLAAPSPSRRPARGCVLVTGTSVHAVLAPRPLLQPAPPRPYFAAWPPSLREQPKRTASTRAVGVVALSTGSFVIHESGDSRQPRLQTLAAFAERFRVNGSAFERPEVSGWSHGSFERPRAHWVLRGANPGRGTRLAQCGCARLAQGRGQTPSLVGIARNSKKVQVR
jgi:hypothetical protein